jgi:type IV pilus assembly protein PilO
MKKTNSAASSLAPVFQAVEKLTKPQRIGIYAGTLVLMILLSVWLLFWPNHKTITGLNARLASAQATLETAKKNARELNDWRNQMKEKEAQYKKVMQALPEKGEIPSLLAGITQAGKDAGLEFLLFKPAAESTKDFYAEIPVNINVSGTYHQVATFFDKVANLPRIVNIRDVTMTPQKGENGVIAAATTCQAVTYKFVEPSAANQKKGRKRK